MNDLLCDNCGHEKSHRYLFCPNCGHDNYEHRKRESVEEYLKDSVDMLHNIKEYVGFDSAYLDRDPDMEREIVADQGHGLIKHRDHDDIESVSWIDLSPEGWYWVSPSDQQCEELFEEAGEWFINTAG